MNKLPLAPLSSNHPRRPQITGQTIAHEDLPLKKKKLFQDLTESSVNKKGSMTSLSESEDNFPKNAVRRKSLSSVKKKPMISESESDSEDSLPSVSKNAVRRKSLSSVKKKPMISESESDSEDSLPSCRRKLLPRKVKAECNQSFSCSKQNIAFGSTSEEEMEDSEYTEKESGEEIEVSEVEDESDGDEEEEEENNLKASSAKKVKITPETHQQDELSSSSGDSSEEETVWKWWNNDLPVTVHAGGVKWNRLEHNGPYFAPPYERLPPDVDFLYNGKPMLLSEKAEEAAGFFAPMLSFKEADDYALICKNFFQDWKKIMTPSEADTIKSMAECDFKNIHQHYMEQLEVQKAMCKTKEGRKKVKQEKRKILKQYGYCVIDGQKQRIGKFKIEPPGLFKGRGDHPKQGKIKRRIEAEDVVINIGEEAEIPSPPPGHHWKEVKHDKKVYVPTPIPSTAIYGGAVCMSFSGADSNNSINFTGCKFESNMACFHGGAIAVRTNVDLDLYNESSVGYIAIDNCSFVNNSGYWGGGVSLYRCRKCGKIFLSATSSNWVHNNAYSSGFAVSVGGNHTDTKVINKYNITAFHVVVMFSECSFSHNTNNKYFRNTNAIGALSITSCDITFSGNTLFETNFGTPLLLKGYSQATFTGNVTFRDNFGINGGAIHLVDGSFMRLNRSLNILFVSNLAIVSGGAIYSSPISESFGNHPVPCMFRFGSPYSANNISVTFKDNIASSADQAVFVGNPAQCNNTILLKEFIYVPDIANQVLTVPKDILLATIPELVDDTLRVMLGEKFFLKPLVIDQFGHNSTAFGYLALLTDDGDQYSDIDSNFTLVGPSSLGMDNYTKNSQFYIQGPDKPPPGFVLQFLYEQTNTYRPGSTEVRIKVVPCKLGYLYSSETQKCECVESPSIICNLTTVCLQQGYWYDEVRKRTIPCSTRNCNYFDGLCPGSTSECPMSPGYCNITGSDDVCEEGKGQFLCSQCRQNYTFNFGAFRCVPDSTCSVLNAFLLALGVVLYWVSFIAVLLIILTLNLRVGSGFMYGLVYYFSVVSLFADTSINSSFLIVVSDIAISMTQLDPRMVVEFLPVCFIKGMDNALHHMMLRYVTPVFVTFVILGIIWASRYCRCPKSISFAEHSPIHALCMLILFSYTSLTHTSLQILHPIVIGSDINIQASPNTTYFNVHHHLPFALVALFVQLIITLPTCFLLILAPCLSRKVNLVKLRLKPIVDEFQACYRPECRWFAGFYFLARQLMFLASIIPIQDLPQSNLVLQCVSLLVLLIHTSFQPYKEKWLNVLDTIFLTDIAFFSVYSAVSVSSIQLSGLNRIIFNATPYVLILIPSSYLVVVVCALLIKHFYNWFKSTRMCSLCVPVFRRTSFQRAYFHGEHVVNKKSSTHSCISISSEGDSLFSDGDNGEREPLLSDNNSVPGIHRNRLRLGQASTSSELIPPWSRSVKNATH